MEDTHVSFLEDEIRQQGERIFKLESAIREAITALSLASYPEYNPRIVAYEVSGILQDALERKGRPQ